MSNGSGYKIFGDDLQLVEIELGPGEGVRAEAGTLVYMETGIELQITTGGGFLKGFKRAATGENFLITNFINNSSDKSHVAFAAPYPGKIIPLNLGAFGGSFICQKDSFLCAAQGVEIEIFFSKKLGIGMFGGEGFTLQRVVGSGMAFVHGGGTVVEKNLQPGETIQADLGCLAAFAPSVKFDVQFAGGFKNGLFGGEGLFLAKMTGPGKLFLQSLPLARLADRINLVSRQTRSENETQNATGMDGKTWES